MTPRLKKILVFNKDHPQLNTAYAKCLRELWVRRISKNKDLTVSIYSTFPRIFFHQKIRGIKIYNGAVGNPLNGENELLDFYRTTNSNLYFTQVDAQVFDKTPEWALNKKLNWVAYVPLDFYPIPDTVIRSLSKAKCVIAMCDWARSELAKHIDNVAGAVYHGVDVRVFKPNENKSPDSDTFDICIVQANRFRKMWHAQLEGIKHFINNNRDIKVNVFAHTAISGEWRLTEIIDKLGLKENVIIGRLIPAGTGYKKESNDEINKK